MQHKICLTGAQRSIPLLQEGSSASTPAEAQPSEATHIPEPQTFPMPDPLPATQLWSAVTRLSIMGRVTLALTTTRNIVRSLGASVKSAFVASSVGSWKDIL